MGQKTPSWQIGIFISIQNNGLAQRVFIDHLENHDRIPIDISWKLG